jgi:hypothetical protein
MVGTFGCCARAASGHAAAEATNVMNARRFTAQRLPVFPIKRVAQLAMAGETAALRDFNPPYVRFGSMLLKKSS